jgi:drug/metabolite transporter (DMT)-like permease
MMFKKNRVRIFGTILLLIGVFLLSYLDNEGIDFVSGILVGLGIGLILTGRILKSNKN